MNEIIYKNHNKILLLHHLILQAKQGKDIDDVVDKKICIPISERYKINFVEIGNDLAHENMMY